MTITKATIQEETPSVFTRLDFWFKKHYGSKKGFIKKWLYYVLYRLGVFRHCEEIDFSQIRRLVFICQGNICRSPLAEAVARAASLNTVSFGLNCGDNHQADPRAIAYAQTMQLDLSAHRTRNINHYSPQLGDLLVGMEPKHWRQLRQLFGKQVPITLAGLWLSDITPYIHDPYNCCAEFFYQCEHTVTKSVQALLQQFSAATRN